MKKLFRSKEQILMEKEQAKHKAVMGKFIDESFMPVMEEVSQTIEQAQSVTEALKIRIAQVFQNHSKTMKLSELKMEEQLRNKSPDSEKYAKVINVLNEKTVDEALTILQGLADETNRVAWNSVKDKKLQDFKQNGS